MVATALVQNSGTDQDVINVRSSTIRMQTVGHARRDIKRIRSATWRARLRRTAAGRRRE